MKLTITEAKAKIDGTEKEVITTTAVLEINGENHAHTESSRSTVSWGGGFKKTYSSLDEINDDCIDASTDIARSIEAVFVKFGYSDDNFAVSREENTFLVYSE